MNVPLMKTNHGTKGEKATPWSQRPGKDIILPSPECNESGNRVDKECGLLYPRGVGGTRQLTTKRLHSPRDQEKNQRKENSITPRILDERRLTG